MEEKRQILIKDYNYNLPDERIAKYPLAQRDHSKLLIYNKGEISDTKFTSLPDYVPTGSLMIFNNTKVIQARLHFHKTTGALIEIFCLNPQEPKDYGMMFAKTRECSWMCLIGNAKKWKDGSLKRQLTIKGKEITLEATRGIQDHTSIEIHFNWNDDAITFAEILETTGEMPIPPYLNRATEKSDLKTYQTVYSKIKGSVAAPTAGLHFTEPVLKALDEKGVERDEITLHIGAGTFKPVKSESIEGHTMHEEWIGVHRSTLLKLIAHNGHCTAVGTTSVRTLESLYYIGVLIHKNPNANQNELHVPQWFPYDYEKEDTNPLTTIEALQEIVNYLDRNNLEVIQSITRIIIVPGYRYHLVTRMVTNFHQPKSTLLLLVSAFVNGDWHSIYKYATDNNFRFLSYGDSSILIPKKI